MNVLLERISDSRDAKMWLKLVFCFISVLIFFSGLSSALPGDRPREKLLDKKLEHTKRITANYEPMPGEMMAGGLGKVVDKNDKVEEIVNKIKPVLERQSGKQFESLEVIHYKPQVVMGQNYFVKARAKLAEGEEQIVHLRIYESLGQSLELTAFQLGKKLEDELDYFQ